MKHSLVREHRVPVLRKQRVVAVFAAALLGASTSASAVDFEVGPFSGSIQSLITFGATWRTQDRANHLIGTSSLNPGLCVATESTTNPTVGNTPPNYVPAQIPDACSTSAADPNDPNDPNDLFVRAPGSFTANGDDGNLNYDKHDVVAAGAKLNSEISFDLGPVSFYANPIYYFDPENSNFDNKHPDTTLQPPTSPRTAAGEAFAGNRFDFNGYHATAYLPFIGGRELLLRVGEQGINWGESTALVFNSINAINPPDATRARFPGFQLEEAFQPVGMAVFSTDITSNLFIEGFYQYEWKPAIADPVGTFRSTSDIAGAGGRYAMLSFAKQPEDPEQIYASADNQEDPLFVLGAPASRTVLRTDDIEPEDGGQYGVSFRYFAEGLNNGTELAFYYANYHARIPSVSAYAADPTCIAAGDATAAALLPCFDNPADLPGGIAAGQLTPSRDPLPVDTVQVALDFPEDIKLYGFSFNTTVGDLALSGEYSYRSNLPVQIQSVDLVYAALQPAFPAQDVNAQAAVIPGRRSAVPDYFHTLFRDRPVDPDGTMNGVENYYIPGFERQKVHQLQFTLLNTFGGANWFNASQIIAIFEFGGTLFPDMPELNQLQFNGAETNTHISTGADGNSNGFDSADFTVCTDSCRQNPTPAPIDHFPTQFSWGYRAVALFRYQNALFGANIEPLLGVFHDVKGIAPGVGQNFQEGRMEILTGLRFDYLNKWVGEVRLTTFTGGSDRNSSSDRDNLMAFVGYNF